MAVMYSLLQIIKNIYVKLGGESSDVSNDKTIGKVLSKMVDLITPGGGGTLPWTELSEDTNINDLQDGGYVATDEIAFTYGSGVHDVMELNAGDTISIVGTQAIIVSSNGFITLQKSSDVWSADAAAMQNEVNTALSGKQDALNYSTNEQVIGTWIDGKPLYEKTLHFSNVVAGGPSTSTMLHGIENIGDAIVVTARYKNDRVTRWADACVYQVDASTYRYISWVVGDTQILAIKSTGDMNASETREYLFVVRYTKTTD